jgi:hypothetical protein
LGGKGWPQIAFEHGILIFMQISSPRKIPEPYDKHFWEKSNRIRKKEEREKMPQEI